MTLVYTQEDKTRFVNKYGSTFEKMKHYDSKQIGDILVKAHNSGLLAICGGLFEEKDINECYVALTIAIGMLKENNLTLPEKYLNNKEQ